MAAPDFTMPRLPSSRPIDQRWDRSRGIVFSRARQFMGRDCTWSSCNPIVFSQPPTSTRSYSIRPLGRSAKGPESNFDVPYKATGFGGMTPEEGARLRNEVRSLEDKIEALARDKQTVEDREENTRKALRAANEEAERARNLLEQEKENHVRELEHERAGYRSQVARLAEEADPEKRENEKVLASVLEKGAEKERQVYERRIRIFNAEHAHQLEQQARLTESVVTLRRTLNMTESGLEKLRQETNSALGQLQADKQDLHHQLKSRREREVINREDYSAYRDIFTDVLTQVYAFNSTVVTTKKLLLREYNLWNKSANEFQVARILRIFQEQDKYRDLKADIRSFLRERANNALTTANAQTKSGDKIIASLTPFKGAAHESRMLTKYHHLETEHSSFETVNLAFMISNVEPLREQREACRALVDNMRAQLVQAEFQSNSTAIAKLRDSLKDAEHDRLFWSRSLDVFETLRSIKAFEALLGDSAVEKAVFIRSRDAAERLSVITSSYFDAMERSGARVEYGVTSEDLNSQRLLWKQQYRQARKAFEIFQGSLRKSAVLENILGQLGPGEQKQHDRAILHRIDKARRLLEINLKALRDMKATTKRTRLSGRVAPIDVVPASANQQPKQGEPLEPLTPAQQLPIWESKAEALTRARERAARAGAHPLGTRQKAKLRRLDRRIQKFNIKAQFYRSKVCSVNPEGSVNASRSEGIVKNVYPSSSSQHGLGVVGDDQYTAQERHSKPNAMRARSPLRALQRTLEEEPRGKGICMKPTPPMRACHLTSMTSISYVRRSCQADSSNALASSFGKISTSNEMRANTAGLSLVAVNQYSVTAENSAKEVRSAIVSSGVANGASANVLAFENSPQCLLLESTCTTADKEVSAVEQTNSVHTALATAELQEPDMYSSNEVEEDGLTYRIPAKDYRAAAMASQNTHAAFWSYRLYKDGTHKSPAVFYCTSLETAEKQAKHFLNQPVLGFDLEWEPRASLKNGNIKQNVSLIQLASEDKIGLFQIALFAGDTVDKLLPPSLRAILESPNVAKTGVNVRGDATRLEKCLNIKMQGIFELSHLYRIVRFSASKPDKVNFRLVSLAEQVEDVLLLPLKKDENRVSAWSRKLTTQQTDYAASDAYAGFRLYHTLETMRKRMTPVPPRPAFHESNEPLQLGDGTVIFRAIRKPAHHNPQTSTACDTVETSDQEEEFFDAVEDLQYLTVSAVESNDTTACGVIRETSSDRDDNANRLWPKHCGETHSTTPQNAQRDFGSNFLWQPSAGIKFEFAPSSHLNSNGDTTGNSTQKMLISGSEHNSSRREGSRHVRPDTLQLQMANSWMESYFARGSTRKVIAHQNELRAYHLWEVQGFEPRVVAAILRDPPLSTSTVASYILRAIKVQDLPCKAGRARAVLEMMPKTMHWRYEKIIERAAQNA